MRKAIILTLFCLFLVILPAAAVNNVVPLAGDVFIGEQGLDITACVSSNTTIAWFAPGMNPDTDPPSYQFDVGDAANFYVAPSIFVGRIGSWYSAWGNGSSTFALRVVDPSLVIKVWANTANKDVTGKEVARGEYLNFRIETNTYPIANRPGYDPVTDGFVTIRVKNPDGTTYISLFQDRTVNIPLTEQTVDHALWYWVAVQTGSGWNSGVTDRTGTFLYKTGTYTVRAELDLNGIKDNYKAPGEIDYIGKTVSAFQTITIGPTGPQGTLYIASYPTGATILINGTVYGQTDRIVNDIPAGIRNLTLTKPGYQAKTVLVDVPQNGVKILAPIILSKGGGPPGGAGTLYVGSYPTNATILINGTNYGRTPGFVTNVPAGVRNLTLTKPGYQAKTVLVDVPAGGTKVLAPISLASGGVG